MDTVLQGLSHVICSLITGITKEEHVRNLDLVLEQLQKRGLKARKKSGIFLVKLSGI